MSDSFWEDQAPILRHARSRRERWKACAERIMEYGKTVPIERIESVEIVIKSTFVEDGKIVRRRTNKMGLDPGQFVLNQMRQTESEEIDGETSFKQVGKTFIVAHGVKVSGENLIEWEIPSELKTDIDQVANIIGFASYWNGKKIVEVRAAAGELISDMEECMERLVLQSKKAFDQEGIEVEADHLNRSIRNAVLDHGTKKISGAI